MRKKSLCSALNVLVDKGLVVKLDGKFALTRSGIEMAAENLVPSSQPLGNAREPEPGTSFPEVSAEYF